MRFPVPLKPHGSSFPDSIAKRYGTSEADERRLFYVALTRAKEHLILASFDNKGKVSSFLLEEGKYQLVEPTESKNDITFRKDRNATTSSEMLRGIGITDLLMLLECPFQYGIRRVFGVYPQVGDELGYGRSMHEIIERSMSEGKWKSHRDIVAVACQHTHIPLESPKQLEMHKQSIAERVASLAGAWTLPPLTANEIPISFILDNVEISGVVDTYVKDWDGTITLIDWKTSIHKEFSRRYEMQMQLYAYALRNYGEKVKGCSIIDVNGTYERGVLAKVDVDVSEGAVSKLIETVTKELAKLRRMQLDPYPSNMTCPSCDVKFVCRYRVKE
jgi:DNA helicase-2/ATP-dependent DNA helicase PcrA